LKKAYVSVPNWLRGRGGGCGCSLDDCTSVTGDRKTRG